MEVRTKTGGVIPDNLIRGSARFFAGVCLFGLVLAGDPRSAIAGEPITDGPMYACVKTTKPDKAKLRFVPKGTPCKDFERRILICPHVQGPPGPPGPRGPIGPRGPRG